MRVIHRSLLVGVAFAAGLSSTAASLPTSSPRLGRVEFDNSCDAAVQATFNRAVALLHSFEFREASVAFAETVKGDPGCGIAYWGIAMDAWGNPFAPGVKPPTQLERGLEAIQRARSIGSKSAREREFVAAAAMLYESYSTVDQPTRLRAYSEAMSRLAAAHPNDIEASIFYALSLAAAYDPADKTYRNQLRAGAMLEKLVTAHPDHPGLSHYIIHAYDFPQLAPRALRAAHRYALIAPSSPHALHMPSHTYTRVGDWLGSIRSNRASTAVAGRILSTSEELHASDYLMYAYLQSGRNEDALHLLTMLPSIIERFDPAAPTGAAPVPVAFFAIAAIPARYALERGAWAEAARLQVRPGPVPWANAVSHFARALGAARSGDPKLAHAEIAELTQIREKLKAGNEAYWAEQTEIQILDASAWLALALGNRADAVRIMRDAAARESATDKSAVTPGPLAPARELLAEMLLEVGQPAAALTEFEKTLASEPNRHRTLAGAVKAARSAGNRAAARKFSARLREMSSLGAGPGR